MVTQEDIDEFGDLWALMYCVFAREMVDSFGEKGEEALIRAVKEYGRARGERLRKRHQEQGLPVNLRSLFEHYDLPGHSGTEKTRTVFEDDKLVSYTYRCPFQEQWRERGCVDVGRRGTASTSTTPSGRSTGRTSTCNCRRSSQPMIPTAFSS